MSLLRLLLATAGMIYALKADAFGQRGLPLGYFLMHGALVAVECCRSSENVVF
jgi:hypothetical protein